MSVLKNAASNEDEDDGENAINATKPSNKLMKGKLQINNNAFNT